MRTNNRHRMSCRRGLTLIEMLVAVGLLVLMMLVIVTIFQSATGSITEQRAYAALDQEMRRIDALIRQDLQGVTARLTPPLDPRENRGYFEYSENALCDSQGEDTDDTLRFTAKAPDGKPFVGRLWVRKSVPVSDPGYGSSRSTTLTPIMVRSDYAEIIYFLRSGNLYRRVMLIRPDLAGKLGVGNTPSDPPIPPDPGAANGGVRPGPAVIGFRTDMFNPSAAFQSPAILGGAPFVSWSSVNDISARPSRFANVTTSLAPYSPRPNTLGDLTDRHNRAFNPRFADDFIDLVGNPIPDGIPDDVNADGVPDYYPTLYNGIFGVVNNPLVDNSLYSNMLPANSLVYERYGLANRSAGVNYDVTAFPYVFPNAYSKPDPNTVSVGWIHSLDPTINPVAGWNGHSSYFGTCLDPPYNHNPIASGDSLPVPDSTNPNTLQTWWGFPSWRETTSPFWVDPIKRLNDPAGAPFFSALPAAVAAVESPYVQTALLSWTQRMGNSGVLPPSLIGQASPYADGAGTLLFQMPPQAVWEDDLLATNVRSFDVKVLDPSPILITAANGIQYPASGYYDLGYSNMLTGTPPIALGTFAHEGRIPPLVSDWRSDAQYPYLRPNIGDDNPAVVRLRRVWDSWSTTYSNAPALPVDPSAGPLGNQPPVYPSYPAPYPAPLRGIQIKIRMTDGDNKRVKNLTIIQDFSDKL